MESKNKAKTEGTKQQQNHRTQEWTNIYQREKDWGRGCGKGGRRGIRVIRISTHNVADGHGIGSTAQRRQVVTL